MVNRLAAWYSRRVVNVNVNIILAGVLALGPVLVVVRFSEYLLSTGLKAHQSLQTHHQLVITGLTFISDVIFDVVIYYCLHWFANHAPAIIAARKHTIEAVAEASRDHVPFLKDATKVQLQRAILSPLLYFLWLGTQFTLMNFAGFTAVEATVCGFVVAIGTVRTLHTLWMVREEQAMNRKLAAKAAGGAGACAARAAENGRAGTDQSLSEKGLKSVSRS